MGTALVVTSGKGGVGKTTTTANLGAALALLNKRVCVVDLDLGLRNLDAALGLQNRIIYTIVDVIQGRAEVDQALIAHPDFNDHLYLLPAAQNADKNVLTAQAVKQVVGELKQKFDFILLDCPAGIETGFENAVAGADGAILVTNPENAAVSDADRIVGLLEARQLEFGPRLIINRIRKNLMNRGLTMSVDQITDHLAIPLLGIVFDDDEVIATANQGKLVTLEADNPAAQGYRNIARRMLGDTVPLMSLTDDANIENDADTAATAEKVQDEQTTATVNSTQDGDSNAAEGETTVVENDDLTTTESVIDDNTVDTLATASESEKDDSGVTNVVEEPVKSEAEPTFTTPAEPKKLSFWQRLFGRHKK